MEYLWKMKMSDIDLTDVHNPHLSTVNGVLMDRRFLGDRVKGTKAYWLKDNLHVARYCTECYTISPSSYEHEKHFTRRVHIHAMDPKRKLPRRHT